MIIQEKSKKFGIGKKQLATTLLVLLLGAGAGTYILKDKSSATEEAGGHSEHAEGEKKTSEHADEKKPAKGSHGGKLFVTGDYGLELTIFENGVEPEFRIYTYIKGKPVTPIDSKVSITLERLGRKPEVIGFLPQKDYLKGNAIVEEPHSFVVKISSQYQGKTYAYEFEQTEGRIILTDEQIKASGVNIASAEPAKIQSVLKLTGEIGLNQDKTVQIVPRLTGLVESVSVNVGEKVRRGQILAVVSSQMLAEQRSDLMAANKRLSMARTNYEREKKLWEDKISAKQDYQQAQQALQETEIAEQLAREKLSSLGALTQTQGRLTSYEIRSPIDGLVTFKKISRGEVLKEDTNIFTVTDLSTVWVDLNIPAKDLNDIKTGQQVTVKSSASDISATGVVSFVSPMLDIQTRKAVARIIIPNAKGIWHAGLAVNVDLVSAETQVPITIAADAVQTMSDISVVFGRYGKYFEARPVELGRSDGKRVEVIKGLEAGEKYASSNSYLIKADIGKSSAGHDH